MNENLNPASNRAQTNDKSEQSPWEFFILKEERRDNLNAEKTKGQGDDADQQQRSWLKRALSEPNGADWIIATFTVVIALVGILQWLVIGGQLTEMKNGGVDTHELAVQAKNQ